MPISRQPPSNSFGVQSGLRSRTPRIRHQLLKLACLPIAPSGLATNGTPGRIRIADPLGRNKALCQLSYGRMTLAETRGFEPRCPGRGHLFSKERRLTSPARFQNREFNMLGGDAWDSNPLADRVTACALTIWVPSPPSTLMLKLATPRGIEPPWDG